MKERLQVKNFGPLKDIDMELRDFTVLIGPQGVGKSVIAKLVLIKNESLGYSDTVFKHSIKYYGISWIEEKSKIEWGEISMNAHTDSETIPNKNTIVAHIKKLESTRLIISNFLSSQKDFFISETDVSAFYKLLTEQNGLKELINNENFPNSIATKKLFIKFAKFEKNSKNLLQLVIANKPTYKISKQEAAAILKVLDSFLEFNELLLKAYSIDPLYIPAERGFLPSITGLTLNLIQNKVPLAPGLLDFGATFEKARIAIPHLENPLLGVTYKYENGTDKIYLKDNTSVDLRDAASGFQTMIPLMLVVEYLTKEQDLSPHYFIIEEPELNLYPSTQKALVEWLVKKCKESGSKLLMTTHSPYILTAMNNLLKAGEVAKQKPTEEKAINKVVKKESWLEFDNVGVYYINKGKAKNLMNKTNRTIDATAIDEVSDELGTAFEKLLDIQYKDQ